MEDNQNTHTSKMTALTSNDIIYIDNWKTDPIGVMNHHRVVGDGYLLNVETASLQALVPRDPHGRTKDKWASPMLWFVDVKEDELKAGITSFPTRAYEHYRVRLLRPDKEFHQAVLAEIKQITKFHKSAAGSEAWNTIAKEVTETLDTLSKLDISPKAMIAQTWPAFPITAIQQLFMRPSALLPCPSDKQDEDLDPVLAAVRAVESKNNTLPTVANLSRQLVLEAVKERIAAASLKRSGVEAELSVDNQSPAKKAKPMPTA